MVISNKWGGWKQADTERAKIVKDMILSDDFWNRVEYALEITEPIMSMLRYADTDEPCLGDIYDAMDSMLERMKLVASSSVVERNWSTYSFIHSMKCNRLGSKKAEDLVFIHTNWCLLSRKDPGYKKGPEKLWDVLPETSDLDMTVQVISRIALLDVEEDVAASGASGTDLDSNDEENDIDEDEATDPSYFDDHLTLEGHLHL